MKVLTTMLLATAMLGGLGEVRAGESVDYLYRLHCSGCHGLDGDGSRVGRIPPFPGIVGHLAGSRQGRVYLVNVPGVANAALPDSETAELLNYILQTWGGREFDGAKRFTPQEVHDLRNIHVDDVAALRRALAAELAKRRISIAY